MFNKILIANRGEIACRVIKTARALGVSTVAVHSDADADARFVKLADEAYRLGPAPAAESYLRGDLILDIAHRSGAQAIHPGYGFLSENEDFAAACEAAGIAFIGPPASAIAAMGSKSAAKALMEQAQVPLVPGYHGERQEADFLRGQADAIGYPVLIKASAGGGGKGMRIVEASADFEAALASCQREARASFGDDKVLVEKYLPRSRHVEIQVFADSHGQCVYLFERDCSVQRRHQKVLEEAPAPDLPPATREAMGTAACAAARAVGYVGAGTVEFIMEVLADGGPGRFFFMEMNTRLQVEHPVTEMITGQDLVAWQLAVASGQPLPLSQEQLSISGHAIEARIYAEDPDKGFLPATGTLYHLRAPAESAVVRIDTGVVVGDSISPFYDPMIAKLIVWGEDRRQALQRLDAALADYQVAGVTTNIPFLRRIVQHASFAGGQVDTGLIARHHDALLPPPAAPDAEQLALLALAEALAAPGGFPVAAGWRLNGALSRGLVFHIAGQDYPVTLRHLGDGCEITAAGRQFSASGRLDGATLRARLGDQQREAVVARNGPQRVLFAAGRRLEAQWLDPLAVAAEEVHGETHLKAPMPGRIVALLAATGVKLNKGDPLLILEAMKMEHTIPAPADGVVKAFYFGSGEQVNDGDELVDFEAGVNPMDPIIINHPGLNLAGYSIATRMENGDNLRQIPEFWGEYAATLRQPLLAALGRADAAEYGLIHDFDPDSGRFGYMIGMECAQPLPLPPGCARRSTPPAKYAVFTTQPAGSDAEFGQAIQAAWRYIMQDWLPASKQWEQAPLGSFERYDGRCAPELPQRQMDIYIPVQPRHR